MTASFLTYSSGGRQRISAKRVLASESPPDLAWIERCVAISESSGGEKFFGSKRRLFVDPHALLDGDLRVRVLQIVS